MTAAVAFVLDSLTLLRRIADAQGGVFDRARALQIGVPSAVIRALLRSGDWVVIRRGIYAFADVHDAAARTPAGAHLLAAAAAVLATTETVVSHGSAALAHGLLLAEHPRLPTLTKADRPGRSSDQLTDGRLFLAPLPDHHCSTLGGVPVTSPARTVSDVSRSVTFPAAVVTADSALRRGVAREDLVSVAEECTGWPGAPCARAAAIFADGDAESPLESYSRVAMFLRGLPRPRLQTWHGVDHRLGRSDFDWRAYATIGEADGLAKYEGKPYAIRAEKRRQEEFEDIGLSFARWDSQELKENELKVMSRIWLRLGRGGYAGPAPLQVPRDWRILLAGRAFEDVWPLE